MKKFTPHAVLICAFVTLITTGSSLVNRCSAQATILYGMTAAGGTDNAGTIFSFNPATDTETILWSFEGGMDGMQPYGSLVYNTGNGLYYGVTSQGGSQISGGVIFSFDPVDNKEKVLDSMVAGTGQLPVGDLAYDPVNGWYYGMTNVGGTDSVGTLFGFDPVNDTMIVYWNFGNDTDGQSPTGRFVYDADKGLFYGMTQHGGRNNVGAIISFDPVSHAENMLWSFGSDSDGQYPNGSLTYDPVNGLFYGMSYTGGSDSLGMIFSFNPANNTETPVWEFKGDGGPEGDLIYLADSGLFYGLCFGSANGVGTIFNFNPATNIEHILYNFPINTFTNGWEPQGDMTFDPTTGLFYGMTQFGGIYEEGTIFSFNPANDSEAMIWEFGDGTDGFYPYGNLSLYAPVKTSIAVVNKPVTAINIYPDPSTGAFTITGLSSGETVQVYNYLGQRLSGVAVENATQQFDISPQANGIYLVQVMGKDEVIVSEHKVVKM